MSPRRITGFSPPLYCIAFALIALLATCNGRSVRGRYAMRLLWAVVAGVALRLLGYGIEGQAADAPALIYALYAIPLLGALVAVIGLAGYRLLPPLPRFKNSSRRRRNELVLDALPLSGPAILPVGDGGLRRFHDFGVLHRSRRPVQPNAAAADPFHRRYRHEPSENGRHRPKDTMPFAVLLGGIAAFSASSKSCELIATRAAGISAWQFLTMPLIVAVLLGMFTMMVFNPIAAGFLARYEELDAKYIRGQDSQLAVSRNGLWLRQGDADHQSVIHALKPAAQGTHLEEVIVFLYQGVDEVEAATASVPARPPISGKSPGI